MKTFINWFRFLFEPSFKSKLIKQSSNNNWIPFQSVLTREQFVNTLFDNQYVINENFVTSHKKLNQLYIWHTMYDELVGVECLLTSTDIFFLRFIGDTEVHENKFYGNNDRELIEFICTITSIVISNHRKQEFELDKRFFALQYLKKYTDITLNTFIESLTVIDSINQDTIQEPDLNNTFNVLYSTVIKNHISFDFGFNSKTKLFEVKFYDKYYASVKLLQVSELINDIVNDKTESLKFNFKPKYPEVLLINLLREIVKQIIEKFYVNAYQYICNICSFTLQIRDEYSLIKLNPEHINLNFYDSIVTKSEKELKQERLKAKFPNDVDSNNLDVFTFDSVKSGELLKQSIECAMKMKSSKEIPYIDKMMKVFECLSGEKELALFGEYFETLPEEYKERIRNTKVKIMYPDVVYKPEEPTKDELNDWEKKMWKGMGVPAEMIDNIMIKSDALPNLDDKNLILRPASGLEPKTVHKIDLSEFEKVNKLEFEELDELHTYIPNKTEKLNEK